MRHTRLVSSTGLALLILISNLNCEGSGKMGGSGGKYKFDAFSSADFPARVESIQFSSGMLSPSSSLQWGSWTVKFPNDQLPIATSGGGGDLVISGLIASNSVQGEKTCTFQACRACAFTGGQADNKQFIRRCRLTIGERDQQTALEIDCPIDVKLKY